MKETRFTLLQLFRMDKKSFTNLQTALEAKAYHLLGVAWTKWVRQFTDPMTGDLVIQYE